MLAAHAAFAQSWAHLSFPGGTTPIARGMNGAPGVYDPASNRMIVFGGRDRDGKNLNDVWVLENANGLGGTPQWVELIPNGAAGSPPARSGHSTVYDSANNRLIIFGGCGGYCAPVLNDVWVLTNANGLGGTPVWTPLQIAGTVPPAPTNAAAAYDSEYNELIVFGGQDGSANPCSTFSDTWTLSNANGLGGSGAWIKVASFGSAPMGQNGAAAAYTTGALILFGGLAMVNGTCTATNDVHELLGPPYFLVVADLTPEGTLPPARSFASIVFDAISGQMLLFGGVDGSGNYLNDVWNFFGQWTQVTPKNSPPAARSGQAAVFDSANERMTIYGGSDASGVLSDTWVLHGPGVSGLSCIAISGVPNILHAEGIAEQVADVVLNCIGGTPAPQGKPIPEYTITYTLNTNITSRLLPEAPELSEALLLIDEPYPTNPLSTSVIREPSSPSQILCTPLGSACSESGTGGTPSPYQTQPNVFVGKQTGPNSLEWKIPIDPPGGNFTRVIRLTNVRANASALPVATGLIPTEVQATVEIQGSPSVRLAGGQQLVVANSLPGISASVLSNASIPQCEPHNAVLLGKSGRAAFDFTVQAQESRPAGFEYPNYGTTLFGAEFPPALVEQNVPGFNYQTETGFYSPSLFTTAPTIGHADFGTRLLVSLGPISAGTHLLRRRRNCWTAPTYPSEPERELRARL
jgi:hypothetical protein